MSALIDSQTVHNRDFSAAALKLWSIVMKLIPLMDRIAKAPIERVRPKAPTLLMALAGTNVAFAVVIGGTADVARIGEIGRK
jgi:hypothetical protein